ncbi:tRNA (guanine-N(7)-)-methyltransferase [Halolactibacillus alkaliphilus]|uniref:tRNA (guanine-N(7)-)-methyltransferase n=1 Tax=Halolactibacillus alkaliphilus TaxID=442899 RepID=A0A511X506_9BACI|nr:tRNA (guanosine(46)-N7)-methyltransferase TrmB [Halolactibacillus alkaliphilus]GEN58020.1 tRNA (guanine-N(7)-)-methyltransferase [Halolactibacillus alkaliphilus]GGN72324.1 tRNA (guanine-N(7)-)-methyltransferase [Halolactibacillus alkaliphilus]SFO89256.1 tRNA (guanine-N(7)-)-methyltransferase [Halolactibacillus alkaliphilus]
MRARHKPWADDYLSSHPEYVILNPLEKKGKWQQVFGNNQPIHVEIGAGKGRFVMGMAKQHPEINFIAIELAKSIIVSAVEKAVEEEPKNVKLINFDANDLRDLFADNEINRIYLNFSDPWPKNRHEKRRLTYHTFLAQYQQVLASDGKIIFKTDNRGLFEYSLMSFSHFDMLIDHVSLNLHEDEDPLNVMTEYEEKFSKRGHPIYRAEVCFRKR